jgi:hypothetical protein
MSSAADRPRRYLLQLQSQGDDDLHRLRALLKVLLRQYGLRCVSIEELCKRANGGAP